MRKAKVVWHKDDDAVSPVIGTILMVAITVVLAAVLWLMVSGMIQEPDSEKLTVQLSSPSVTQYERPAGTATWDAVLNIQQMTPKDEKVKWTEIRVSIKDADGSILNGASTVSDDGTSTYTTPATGATTDVLFWFVDIQGDGKVGAGDAIKITGMDNGDGTLGTNDYQGALVQILKGGKIIADATLPTDFA